MRTNPGRRVTIWHGVLFGLAFNSLTTPEKAAKGFEATGLWTLNEETFREEDFAPSCSQIKTDPAANEPRQLGPRDGIRPFAGPSRAHGSGHGGAGVVSGSRSLIKTMLEEVSPFPKAPKTKRVRKPEEAKTLTS